MDLSERIINDLKNNNLPEHIKNMIIDASMPLGQDERIKCLLYISLDDKKEISERAAETLNILDQGSLIDFVRTQKMDDLLFKAIVKSMGKHDKIVTTAITHKDFNEAVAREILRDETTPLSTLELFSINQAMFYKFPQLIDILFENNRITKEISDRLTRYREGIIAEERMREGIKKGSHFSISEEYELVSDTKAAEQAKEAVTLEQQKKPDAIALEEGETLVTDLAIIEEIYEDDQIFNIASSKRDKASEKYEKESSPKKRISVQNLINTLSVSGQIKLAFKGNKEARSILIRSPKKIIAQAVLQNPKINENEIEFYAKLRNISEDILRSIARNPEWVKKPSIMRGLLYNPKTPASIAMSFLSRITKKEIKDISKSKSLPQAIRIAAKRLVMQDQAREDKLRRAGKK